MKWIWIALLGLCVVPPAGAQVEDAEPAALAALAINARQLAEQTGGRLLEEGLALEPGGRAACALNFPTNQMYTFVLMARGEAEPWPHMEIRLNTNLVYAAAAASNWSSYAFTQVVAPGRQQLEIVNRILADGARPAVLHIACLTVTAPDGVPAPVLVTNAAAAVVTTAAATNAPAIPRPLAAAATNPAPPAATTAVPVIKKWDVPVGR